MKSLHWYNTSVLLCLKYRCTAAVASTERFMPLAHQKCISARIVEYQDMTVA